MKYGDEGGKQGKCNCNEENHDSVLSAPFRRHSEVSEVDNKILTSVCSEIPWLYRSDFIRPWAAR